MSPGSVVQWVPLYARNRSPMRGTVTRVEAGRVYLRIERRSNRGRRIESEVWFDPGEVHRLTIARGER